MHIDTHTGLESPRGGWWQPAHKSEKVWVGIAFVWCMVLFAMMPLWHWKGGQNPSGIRTRTTPAAYGDRLTKFIADYQTGDDRGIPIVRLQKGVEYTLHLSSLDVNHGFSLYPINVNFQVVPGYDYGLRVTPNASGDFRIICNEFCGIGHHLMVGRVVVDDAPRAAGPSGTGQSGAAR